jgi:hypothetical protein
MPRQSTNKQASNKLDSLEKTLNKLYKNTQQNNDLSEEVLRQIESEKKVCAVERLMTSATVEELSLENITKEVLCKSDLLKIENYIVSIERKRREVMPKYARTNAKINAKIRASYKIKTMSEFTKEEMEGFITAVREYDKNFDGLDGFEDEFEDPFYHGFVEDDDYDEDMF